MKLVIASAVLANILSGTAIAEPAGTTEAVPASPTPSTPAFARSLAAPAPTALPLATPALTQPSPKAPAPTELKWYGWQVLLADGAILGFAVLSRQADVAVGWVGAGAAVHAGNGHYGRSAASVGLRVALPFLGAALGASGSRGCTGDFCGLGDVVGGALVGAGIAEVVDLVMATNEHEVAPPKPSTSWTPVASVRPAGATFGIAARF